MRVKWFFFKLRCYSSTSKSFLVIFRAKTGLGRRKPANATEQYDDQLRERPFASSFQSLKTIPDFFEAKKHFQRPIELILLPPLGYWRAPLSGPSASCDEILSPALDFGFFPKVTQSEWSLAVAAKISPLHF